MKIDFVIQFFIVHYTYYVYEDCHVRKTILIISRTPKNVGLERSVKKNYARVA